MDTIGQQLKKIRQARNLTVEKVVEETRIRANYIEAMEADSFEALPSPVQARGFLRLYAEFLGISMEDLIANQRSRLEEAPSTVTALPSTPTEPEAVETDREASRLNPPTEIPSGRIPASIPAFLSASRLRMMGWLEKSKAAVRARLSPGIPAGREPGPTVQAESGPAEPSEGEPARPAPAAEPSRTTRQSLQSQAIYSAIGKQLRDRREGLSLALEEIERHIHVRTHYLEMLERGDLHGLPSSVQARGMLANYAHFLDLDVDAVLLQFADGLQAQLLERQSQSADTTQSADSKARFRLTGKVRFLSSWRRYLSPDLLVGGGLILFLIVFAIWATVRVVELRASQAPQPTAPLMGEIPVASPGVTLSPSPTAGPASFGIAPAGEATQAIAIPTGGQGRVHIVVVALGSTWVRVSVDGKVKFEGRITQGTPYLYDGNNQIEVLTGDGSAVGIIHNQNDLGPMGTFGEVVDRIYTTDAVLRPTATFTPTPTRTPIPSATPRTTPTARTTPTPTIP